MKYGAVVLGLVLLAGCSEKVHDMAYYKEHEAERKATLETCNNNPGEKRNDPNCINAFEAQWRSGKVEGTGANKAY